MVDAERGAPVAVLASGGIDSAVLTAELCARHAAVHPVFVRGGLRWECAELEHLKAFLAAIARPALRPLKIFDEPVTDVYGDHWSTTGRGVPDGRSADEAVFLPGRNLFLITKVGVWCALNRIGWLAIGSLDSNPFPDSTPEFFAGLEQLIARSLGTPVRVLRPLGGSTKADVVKRGAMLPLELTFSCIDPRDGQHCGVCNKCSERRQGFRAAGVTDRTHYAR